MTSAWATRSTIRLGPTFAALQTRSKVEKSAGAGHLLPSLDERLTVSLNEAYNNANEGIATLRPTSPISSVHLSGTEDGMMIERKAMARALRSAHETNGESTGGR